MPRKGIARLLLLVSLFAGGIPLAAAQLVQNEAAFTEGRSPIGVDEKLGRKAPIEVPFYDEQGAPITLAQAMNGKTTVLALVFFECEGICTPLLNGLADVVKHTPALKPGSDYQIVTVSFDPKDRPATAAPKRDGYVKLAGVAPEGWRFLTGGQESIDKLTDGVGFRYLEQGGTFIHSAVLTILAPDGTIARYLYGGDKRRDFVPFLPLELQLALSEASQGRVGSAVHKVMQLCFQYDPVGKRYVLSVTRIAMAVVMLFAICVALYVTIFSRIGRDTKEAHG